MIEVTLLSGKTIWLSPHQMEAVEAHPDTTITMISGKRIVVLEDIPTLVERIVAYRRRIGNFADEP
ncbi:MAG TPA: flagellar FlbD family protein [Rectinemataceae bacterium]|nr:flagellar FlbD family protein [Rectinemataceae bacterium]